MIRDFWRFALMVGIFRACASRKPRSHHVGGSPGKACAGSPGRRVFEETTSITSPEGQAFRMGGL
jgi:hypothetical protein